MWKGDYPIKLELGSGQNPQPGYIHLDLSAQMPHVEIVHDINHPLPIPDKCVTELLANHCLEHVSWRKIKDVLSECHRVLVPNGRIFIRTPDLEYIVKTYLTGQTTPEYPPDEQFIHEHIGSVTPSWWAILKLFSGQDYPGNYHYACYDLPTLQNLFQQAGFKKVNRLHSEFVFSPGEIQLEAYK